MAVTRQTAYVGEQILLKMLFSSNTGQPVIPANVSKVEIQPIDGATVLETITAITNVGSGVYGVTTSAAWNTTARQVRDVWYYEATSGGVTRQAIGTTYIAAVAGTPDGQLMTASEVKAIPTGVDISGYTDTQLDFWIQVAQTMVEDYTSRKFGAGSFTEKGETVIDRTGRVILSTRAVPIDSVSSVEIWVPGTQKIPLSIQYLDIYNDRGYMYYNTQQSIGTAMASAYPSVVLTRADRVSYEMSYTTSATLPVVLKQAIAIIVGNLAKKNKLMQETGVSGITGSVKSFRSGDYGVNFGNDESRNGYKPQGRGVDDILTPDVMEILKKYKFIKQNLF